VPPEGAINMYNVNTLQIDHRLTYLSTVVEVFRLVNARNSEIGSNTNILDKFALERAIHVAAESITDIGNYLIDGFVMRDAASYEDIVDILFGEQVFPKEVYDVIYPAVQLRKPLVQSYSQINQDELNRVSQQLPDGIVRFVACIKSYLSSELGTYK
jgi:uncharacterized protein YutE (UPF0331/DUF86 family)